MAKSTEDNSAATSKQPKRNRKWLKWSLVIFFALVVIGALTDDEDADQVGAAQRQTQSEIAQQSPAESGFDSAETDQGGGSVGPVAQHSLPEMEPLDGDANSAEMGNTGASQDSVVPETSWNIHDFTVVEDEDISSSIRIRRRVTIVAPTALTREERIATLIEAATQAWHEHHSQFIAMFLVPFESGPVVARINYAPDKCGISGEDCTGQVWTAAHASDFAFTDRQRQIYTAWYSNEDKFEEVDEDYGFELVNEDKLKAFLGEQFNTTPDSISEVMTHALSAVFQEELTVPHNLELRGHLNEEEQKISEEMACRASLQCWGDKHSTYASVYCPDLIERLGRFDHEWTDGWLESKFSRFAWKDRKAGTLTYIGDQIKFQNGFGAWIHHTYHCDFDPVNKKVLDVRANAGRL